MLASVIVPEPVSSMQSPSFTEKTPTFELSVTWPLSSSRLASPEPPPRMPLRALHPLRATESATADPASIRARRVRIFIMICFPSEA